MSAVIGVETSASIWELDFNLCFNITVGVEVSTSICKLLADNT